MTGQRSAKPLCRMIPAMPLNVALVHFPVRDKFGHIVNTSITNFDIHDIARASRTYGVHRYYLVAPVDSQREFVGRVIAHWSEGPGMDLNITRKEALEIVRLVRDLNEVAEAMAADSSEEPVFVATSARPLPNCISYEALRERIDSEPQTQFCIVLGTGYGLDNAVVAEMDLMLPPLSGPGDWNHLSVRSACSIILDRLRGNR